MGEAYANVFASLGLLGVAFYLGSYASLQFGLIRGSGYLYGSMNLIGASLVLISLTVEYNLASVLIQVSWIVISIVGLTRLYLRSRRLVVTDEETTLLRERLPNLPKPSARDFFKSGGWCDLPAGEVLLREGASVENLFYLASGSALIHSGGTLIATHEKGFLGEINVLEGAPASATVTTNAPSRAFVIPRTDLIRLMAKNDEFRSSIENCLSQELGKKLVQANRRLIGVQADLA